MSVVSKRTVGLQRKRLTGVLCVVGVCALLGACSDDDRAVQAAAQTSADNADAGGSTPLAPNPLASTAPAPSLTIQSPALPALSASSADAALSAAASTPLATPVIHTVD
ncbi:hypothetical protein P3T18_005204 [Paraburkholderia sp. GAS199]|uniref:hypothetical protein n=1 Tax=Paraburkholderia sp. GAS199 TaxID=3035126 RepID=UPI003D223CAC